MANTLTSDIIKSFKVGVSFTDKEAEISSNDFSTDGKYMIVGNHSEQIIWLDCLRGKEIQVINSYKYGVGIIKYTHGKTAVLHSSKKVNNAIRLVDVEKQSYIRYYSGHERDVTSLAITASQDIFVSGSEDKTVKVWDFRKETPVGNIHQSMSNPIVAFEPTGELFFVGFENRSILAYDLRSYKDNKYIDKFTFDRNPHNVPSDFKFSKDGRILLISTNGSEIMLYEADSKKHLANLTGFANTEKIPLEASFTPDSKFVLSGSSDGFVHFWSTEDYLKVTKLRTIHQKPIKFVKFNPKYMMFASCCSQTAFWLPDSTNPQTND